MHTSLNPHLTIVCKQSAHTAQSHAHTHARTLSRSSTRRQTTQCEAKNQKWNERLMVFVCAVWCGCVESSRVDSFCFRLFDEIVMTAKRMIVRLMSIYDGYYRRLSKYIVKKRNQEETSLSGAVCELVDWKYEQNVCARVCMQSQGILALYSLVEFWACAHLWCWKLLNDVLKRNNKL